ncbi:MAG: nucleotide pyrophosphohydrolase [Bacteroidia bacterium]|nr:nucleotide pyrophosphohydrolase [Bacteroidia bacterium]MDW8302988.1 nucleotide pyrophosphohydrolase [Bacteroidia bacterium]
MDIETLQKTVDSWIKSYGVRYYNELTNTALLMEEVGELASLMARIYGEQSFKNPEEAAHASVNLADEMADVLFVLVCLANQTGVNLTEAIQKNLDKKTLRDKERHKNNLKLKG